MKFLHFPIKSVEFDPKFGDKKSLKQLLILGPNKRKFVGPCMKLRLREEELYLLFVTLKENSSQVHEIIVRINFIKLTQSKYILQVFKQKRKLYLQYTFLPHLTTTVGVDSQRARGGC